MIQRFTKSGDKPRTNRYACNLQLISVVDQQQAMKLFMDLYLLMTYLETDRDNDLETGMCEIVCSVAIWKSVESGRT